MTNIAETHWSTSILFFGARPVYLETRNLNDTERLVYFIDQNGMRTKLED